MLEHLHVPVAEFTGMMNTVVDTAVSWVCVDMRSSIKYCCCLGFHPLSQIIFHTIPRLVN